MKAQDLRIGNLLSERNGHFVEVAVVNSNDSVRIYNHNKTETLGYYPTSAFNPIPITTEFLLKSSFAEDGSMKTKGGMLHYNNNTVFISDERDTNYAFSVPCEYVHQLQNLCFALTGEELTFNK